jgi:hypothetical protein
MTSKRPDRAALRAAMTADLERLVGIAPDQLEAASPWLTVDFFAALVCKYTGRDPDDERNQGRKPGSSSPTTPSGRISYQASGRKADQ